MDLKEAYASMKADKEVGRDFVLSRGIPEEDFAFLAIDMEQKFKSVPQFNDDGDLVHREQVFDGYKLTRGFKVTSDDIDLIERISQEVTELIEENVYITSYPPKYFYTQLGELKIQMIAAASADGQTRARTAVEGAGDGRISQADAEKLLAEVKDGNKYTAIEKDTVRYLRDNFAWTDAADEWFRKEVRKWAAERGAKK